MVCLLITIQFHYIVILLDKYTRGANMKSDKSINYTSWKPSEDVKNNYWTIYDKIPYVRDKELCNESNIVKVSGNIIKAYRYLLKDTYEIKHEA